MTQFFRGDIVSFKNQSDILSALLDETYIVLEDMPEDEVMIPVACYIDKYAKAFFLANECLTLIKRANYE